MLKKAQAGMDFHGRELEVLEFWSENEIFKKALAANKGAEPFTFYDGPPTANGRPHIGHVLTRSIKDLIPRYQAMKGKDVLRKAGWDTHGLPVELEVERKLGLDGKDQIEEYGIEPFIKACKESVWGYKSEWERMSERVGFWADMEHPYVTYDDSYIESVWWSLKRIADKGLLYKGHKVVPYCPRCGTALSSHEVSQGYKSVKERSAYVRFKIKGEDNAYFYAWTTTPWTLPSNVALCVGPKYDYARFTYRGHTVIMADALIKAALGEDAEIADKTLIKGVELVGMEYEPLFDFVRGLPDKPCWRVISSDFVTTEDGTGIVHIAPAFGEDDARVGRENDLPFLQLVDAQGRMDKATPWAGTFVKEADKPIIEDLEARGALVKTALYEHDYPFCWRCDTPLIYYARPTWFIRVTAVRDALIASNQSVNWMPSSIKDGRMGNFIENVIDWGLSRERYWGTPLPVWVCECGHTHVIGSRAELEELGDDVPEGLELHRPYIDAITLTCPKCGRKMRRTPEVIDCWYDSGSMPFAQWHYPFENKEKFEANFPANFISEAIDQTRGWFYTLLAIGTLVFGRAPFENCIVLGHVNDKDGKKMSKHLGNVVSPWEVLDAQGADAVRWYFYTAGAPWLPSRFSPDMVAEKQRKFMGTLWNTYAFFTLYASIDGYAPSAARANKEDFSLMDRWLRSKLNSLVKYVDEGLAAYKIAEPARAIEDFVDEMSNWYVRRCRERFWGKGMAGDKLAAFETLYETLVTLCGLCAPFTPFIAETMYQNLVRGADENAPISVHLTRFPACDESQVDPALEEDMEKVIAVVSLGRACRNTANIKVRQRARAVYVCGEELNERMAELTADELNVMKVVCVKDARAFTTYNLKPQLRTVGPRYGKLVGKIGARLKELDGNEAMDTFARGETLKFELDGAQIELAESDVLAEKAQKAGFAVESDKSLTVALDVVLTEALIDEGYVREVISKLQNMRKDAKFEVTDRIGALCECEGALKKAMDGGADEIKRAVLATSFNEEAAPDGACAREWDINGEKATLTIWKK